MYWLHISAISTSGKINYLQVKKRRKIYAFGISRQSLLVLAY